MRQGRLSVFRWACGFAAGVSLFFTFGVAQTLFGVFPRETVGAILQHIFPVYFGTLLVASLVAATAAFPLPRPTRRNLAAFLLIVIALISLLVVAVYIGPRLQAISVTESRETFRMLHGISMSLNLLAMICTIGAPLCAVPRESRINRSASPS